MSRLTVIAGPMFSSKSTELLRVMETFRHGNVPMLALKPRADTRDPNIIFSRSFPSVPAYMIGRVNEFETCIRDNTHAVLCIDEAHFFGEWFVTAIHALLERRARDRYEIFISCLDMDSSGRPFGPIPGALLAMADTVIKTTAVCVVCAKEGRGAVPAQLTHKFAGDKHASVEIGDSDLYQPVCRHCFSELTQD